MSRVDGLLDRLQVRLLIDAGKWEDAGRLIGTSDLSASPEDAGWIECDLSDPVLCLSALHAGRADEARVLAGRMVARCREAGRTPAMIRALLLSALAADALDDHFAVSADVGEAVYAAAKEGMFQPFLECDVRLLPLLRRLQREAVDLRPGEADFLSELILRIVATAKAKAHSDELTMREREVLVHLRLGRSNKVIAGALNLTENAVKFHMKNVFRKLGVDSRTMAAAVAQHLPFG